MENNRINGTWHYLRTALFWIQFLLITGFYTILAILVLVVFNQVNVTIPLNPLTTTGIVVWILWSAFLTTKKERVDPGFVKAVFILGSKSNITLGLGVYPKLPDGIGPIKDSSGEIIGYRWDFRNLIEMVPSQTVYEPLDLEVKNITTKDGVIMNSDISITIRPYDYFRIIEIERVAKKGIREIIKEAVAAAMNDLINEKLFREWIDPDKEGDPFRDELAKRIRKRLLQTGEDGVISSSQPTDTSQDPDLIVDFSFIGCYINVNVQQLIPNDPEVYKDLIQPAIAERVQAAQDIENEAAIDRYNTACERMKTRGLVPETKSRLAALSSNLVKQETIESKTNRLVLGADNEVLRFFKLLFGKLFGESKSTN